MITKKIVNSKLATSRKEAKCTEGKKFNSFG